MHRPGPAFPAATPTTIPAAAATLTACESVSVPSEQPVEESERLIASIP